MLGKNVGSHANLEPDIEYVMSIWDNRRWEDDWVDRLDRVQLMKVKIGSSRAKVAGLALLLRSVFSLTTMARSIPACMLRNAEVEWNEKFPTLMVEETIERLSR
jgi:hypothetical protein